MKVYFVTNDKWYSRLMRWLSDSEITHVGIGFNEADKEIIFDISKPVGSAYPREIWFKKYREVCHFEILLTEEELRKAFIDLWNYAVNEDYDMNSYYYAIWVCFLHKFLFFSIPSENSKADLTKKFCTNIIDPVKDILKSRLIPVQYINTIDMTPQMLKDYLERFVEMVK